MNSEIKKVIEDVLKSYQKRSINIEGKDYNLYIFSEDEDLNLFEGFLTAELKNKSDLSFFISRYRAPVSGYVPRMSLLFYEDQLLIKDYRRNKYIRKTLGKINRQFISKVRKALSEPNESNLSKLFDRTDIIEEFYILYKKARDYLLKNIKGISEEEKREEFVDNFMMQMLTLWYLQERGFFNNDTSYLVTKFNELDQKNLFKDYYEFLTYFFNKICNHLDSQYYEDTKIGKVVVVGPAIFLNGKHDSKAISIPDKCFYKKGMTEVLINTQPKKVSQEVPLLNLFESRDWTEGNIDEFVLGAIYEKLITYMERKKLGAYYTPEEITSYICKNTIEPYLIDRINEKFNEDFESIDQVIESEDRNILSFLFQQLKEIKVLDPAVGSAHFLESAINVLVSVYEKLWDKARELGLKKGFEIIATDEQGRIKTIDLLEIFDEEQFKLYVKFFIILSKNIYGVDINPSALKVAKARLFLTLAKHFDAQKNYFIRFPNVHFNLREGNSLVGYAQLEEGAEKKGQLVLDLFVKEDEVAYIAEKVKVVSDLKEHLNETAEALKLNGNIIQEIEKLNKILSKNELGWMDFKDVLRTKEKLISILIASLNSKYATPLNDLINYITELFNDKLDEKFAEENNIDLAELKQIKTFHWIFEFPEVFLGKEGFDVVVGNPPHGAEIGDIEKELWQESYKLKERGLDSAKVFLERSIALLHPNAPISFVIPKPSTYSFSWEDFRNFVKELHITYCIDFGKAFENVKHEQIGIILWKKDRRSQKYIGGYFDKMKHQIIETGKIPLDTSLNYGILGCNLNKIEISIAEYFLKRKFIKMASFDIFRGVPRNLKADTGEPCYKGKNIGRYYISLQLDLVNLVNVNQNTMVRLKRKKVIAQRIVAHVTKPFERIIIMSYPDSKSCLSFETVTNIIPDRDFSIKSLSLFLNSKFVSWFVYTLIYNKARRDMDFDAYFVERIILPSYKNFIGSLDTLCEILLFLNATNERRNKLKETIEYFDCKIADSLVYELYFKEKFYEDGLYPEPKGCLLELVSKHLKPIDYDRWSELYWKKQLEEKLTTSEEKELEELEKENLKTIEEVYKSLKNDKQIQDQIKKIKSHEWIKTIEGDIK